MAMLPSPTTQQQQQHHHQDIVDPSSSPFKVIEISALDIVNRINRPLLEKVQKITEVTAPGDISISPDGSNNRSSETINSPKSLDSVSTTDEDSIISQSTITRKDKVLGDLQKWIQEAEASSSPSSSTSHLQQLNNYYLTSIQSYLNDLPQSTQKLLKSKFNNQLINYFKELFKKPKSKDKDSLRQTNQDYYNYIYPSWTDFDAKLTMAKLSLVNKLPGFNHCFDDSPNPMIYATEESVGMSIVQGLFLHDRCLRVFDSQVKGWTKGLEDMINCDEVNNNVPVILILNVASLNIELACKLASSHGIWVHLYGRNVLGYLVERGEEKGNIFDSWTVDLRNINNNNTVPKMSLITVLKLPKNSIKSGDKAFELIGLKDSNRPEEMLFLQWYWAKLTSITTLKSLITNRCNFGLFLLSTLEEYDDLSIVRNWTEDGDSGSRVVSTVLFRYCGVNQGVKDKENEDVKVHVEDKPSDRYIETVNSWLFHILSRDLLQYKLILDYVHIDSSGWHILIDLFKMNEFNVDNEQKIVEIINSHMRVLRSTVLKKLEFNKLVDECEELELVDYESQWAGLGAVRFRPGCYRNVSGDLLDDEGVKGYLNHLNGEIVERLKLVDGAFSLGTTITHTADHSDSNYCVQFGMVTLETDVAELVRLVILTGEEIEEKCKVFSEMEEVVKRGIKLASQELARESADALWEEGILRHVPIVSTFVNWWSPVVKEAGVRGRALNIVEGKVESTENIYKYHRQVKEGEGQNQRVD